MMRSIIAQAASSFVLLAVYAAAQTPPFNGELLLEPGLNNGKCLTAASSSDGAVVTIQTCTGAAAQKWTFTGGSVKIFGNKCLDIMQGSTANDALLQIWTCTSANQNQQFYYTRDNRLVWTNHGKCMDLPSGNQADGTRIQLWGCSDGNVNQIWNTGYMASSLPPTS
ncbi:ricin B lectin domain-containing protein, partial [Crucibulum laeve]